VSEPSATPACGSKCLIVMLVAVLALVVVPVTRATSGESQKREARRLAAEVAMLDDGIDAAVERYARATAALEAVRSAVAENRRRVREARDRIEVARLLLAERARCIYKQATPNAVDVLLGVSDFTELVGQLSLMDRLGGSDADYVRQLRVGERELQARSLELAADRATAVRLVARRAAELEDIRRRLARRRALLSDAETRVSRLSARGESTVRPPSDGSSTDDADGSERWWPLIEAAASSRGVSASGMYRLMMVESGGSATVVGAGRYYGLFQYSKGTWSGSWNPYRDIDIVDGPAQIKATALAIARGYGPVFWPHSYGWAF
jgi:hypothetical protein